MSGSAHGSSLLLSDLAGGRHDVAPKSAPVGVQWELRGAVARRKHARSASAAAVGGGRSDGEDRAGPHPLRVLPLASGSRRCDAGRDLLRTDAVALFRDPASPQFPLLTLPPKTSRPGFGVLHRLREGELDEREAVYGGADHRGAQGARGRSADEGSLPAARDQRAESLPLEG